MRNLTYLIESAEKKWILSWISLFSDQNGGFHERLSSNQESLDMPKRLLTQCRQIIVYSQYIYKSHPDNPIFIDKLNESFQYLLDFYHRPETGGSVFSVNSDNSTNNAQYDLYAHAFIILACSEYYKATRNEKALALSKTTLNFIEQKFKTESGYLEALDKDLNVIPATRRQNPHMHLMEACVYMYETSEDKDYLNTATNILNLFFDKFLDQGTSTFNEFFDDDLKPDPNAGHIIEAGHHAEWIWLLKRYQQVSGLEKERITKTMGTLFTWVKKHGTDEKYGGVYNTQKRDGTVIDDGKRIWQQFETLRAAAIMTREPEHQAEAWDIVQNLLRIIRENYIASDTGTWIEILNRDLTPQSDFLPATSPYHIYPALKDVMKYILNPHYSWGDAKNRKAIKQLSRLDETSKDQQKKSIENLEDEINIEPGTMGALLSHQSFDKEWKVENGVLMVISNGELFEITAGNSISIPQGCAHSMTNTSNETITVTQKFSGKDYETGSICLLNFTGHPSVPLSTKKEAQSAILYSELHEEICQKFDCEHKPNTSLITDEYKKAINAL